MNLKQALKDIEEIVSDDFCCGLEMRAAQGSLSETEKMLAEKLTAIYMIAHGVNEDHTCYGIHKEWCKKYED